MPQASGHRTPLGLDEVTQSQGQIHKLLISCGVIGPQVALCEMSLKLQRTEGITSFLDSVAGDSSLPQVRVHAYGSALMMNALNAVAFA